MSAKKTPEKTIATPKETLQNEVALQLSKALQSLKEDLGEKKFEKRIKKAAKLLTEGIKNKPVDKVPVATKSAAKPKKAATVKKVTKVASSK
jgi:hypothetical protein